MHHPFDLRRWLPDHLMERVRWVRESAGSHEGDFVLYWMRAAIRIDENPALDVARTLAESLGKPLLVYHGLSQRYPYASDRHHTFILEGARDVQGAMASQGLSYAMHLERPGHDAPVLRELARAATCVVTEDMPTCPANRFLKALCREATCSILAVDTACLLPMQMVGQAYTRAYAYREATWEAYRSRVRQSWPTCDARPEAFDLKRLPFQSVDLQSGSIADWVAQCDIDHLVGPVLDTSGGSVAGYARWDSFASTQLARYDKRRNDPLVDGVSRMSAYLHYGMVSPFRIAREAASMKGSGPEKFLDELLIWRELAYAFCFYRPDHEQWSALPEWARRTLEMHARDPRPALYSWETLARGVTDDSLWNAAQRSLLVHGELHNNIRMTWGKAILNWLADPRAALAMMIDLNHRYALDGRDPASYGGLLWCLGQFDRPFEPELPILGTVRPRSTSEHARRLEVARYAAVTTASRCPDPPAIALVGENLASAIAARTLADHGLKVTLVSSLRGSSQRLEASEDLGGVAGIEDKWTVAHPVFGRYVASWVEQKLLRGISGSKGRWEIEGNFEPVIAHLVRGITRCEATAMVVQGGSKVRAMDGAGNGVGMFDRVILAWSSRSGWGDWREELAEQAACFGLNSESLGAGWLADEKDRCDSGEVGFEGCWVSPDGIFTIPKGLSRAAKAEQQFLIGCGLTGHILRRLRKSLAEPKQGMLF